MKKLLLFIIILNSYFLTAQKIGADVVKFSGKVTSTVRDSFDVPTGESWLIWNVTTEQFEVGDDTETWGPLMGDGTGAVVSVNGKAGTVVINPDDLDDTSTTNKFITAALLAKLDGIETGAEVNVVPDWNATTGDGRILNKPTLGDLAAKDYVENTDIFGGGINGQVLTTDGAGVVTWENSSGGTFATITGDPYDNTLLAEDLNGKADDDEVVKLTTNQTAAGNKTWTGTSNHRASIFVDNQYTAGINWTDNSLMGVNPVIESYRSSNFWYIQNNESNEDGTVADLARFELHDDGEVRIYGAVTMPGEAVGVTGTEMLTIDSSGNVDSQAIPSGGSGDALTTNPLSQFASTTSAQLAGVLSDETGSGGGFVRATSPTLVTPALGTPSALVLTNATGLVSAGIVDGTIVNADISASASIDGTKVALTPFGDIASTNVQDGIEELYTEQGTQISTNSGNISTNVADIAAIEASLATVPASSISYNNQTAPYTLVAADAQDNKIVRLAYDGEDLTLPSSVFTEGQAVKISYAQTGIGDANIVEGSGTSILGYTDGITLSAYPSGVTLSRISSATAPEVYEVVDYYGTIVDYAGCTPNANQKAITANGASDPNCNEANATTGFVATTNITLSTISTGQNVGLYAVKGTSTSSISYMTYRFAAVAGGTYTVTFDVNKTVGTDQRLTAWENCTGGPSSVNVTASVWAAKTYNITATATADVVLRFYAAGGSGSSGDDILVDNLSIVHTNP